MWVETRVWVDLGGFDLVPGRDGLSEMKLFLKAASWIILELVRKLKLVVRLTVNLNVHCRGLTTFSMEIFSMSICAASRCMSLKALPYLDGRPRCSPHVKPEFFTG